jgi:uncharacterized membrane protein
MTIALALLVALVMLGGGVAHLATPDQFAPLVPSIFPATLVIIATGVLQSGIGVAALLPRTRRWAGLAFAVLCLAYMPLHLWDFVRPDPIFAPPLAATLRILVQLLFIATGWALWRRDSPST